MNWTSSAPVHPVSAQMPLDRAAAAEAMPFGSRTTPQTLAAVLDVHVGRPEAGAERRVVPSWRT